MEFIIKNRVKILSILLIMSIIILIWLLIVLGFQDKNSKNDGTFSSIGEVMDYLDAPYIKNSKSKASGFDRDIYLTFKYLPVDENGNVNEQYYKEAVYGIANQLNYQNFRLVDEKNDITIEVKCDAEKSEIASFVLNGDVDYFGKIESDNALKEIVEIKRREVKVNSSVLSTLVKTTFDSSSIKFENKTSSVDGYSIYFDSGIKIRIISGTVFNIVFTNKYNTNVVNDISVGTSLDDVIGKCGDPDFGEKDDGLIGYAFDGMYAFFTDSEISVYPYINYKDNTKISDLIEYQGDNFKTLVGLFTEAPYDGPIVDKYEHLVNGCECLDSLMGVELTYGIDKDDGIYIYNNYEGYLKEGKRLLDIVNDGTASDIPYVHIVNENSLYLAEQERLQKYMFEPDTDNSNGFFELSFITSYDYLTDTEQIDGMNVVVKNNAYPDRFISNDVSSYLIISDYYFVYSVKNVGMYLYNVKTGEKKELSVGSGNYEIESYDNGTLKYDSKEIVVSLD